VNSLNPGVPTNPVSDLASAVWVGSRRVHYVYENASPTLNPTLPTVDTEDKVVVGNLGGVGLGGVALDGDVLTYSAGDPSRGTVVVAPDGSYVYTPDADLAHNGGTDTFTASVSGIRLVRHVFGYAGFLKHVVPKLAPTGSTAADTTVVTVNVPLGLVNAAPTVDSLTLDAANNVSGAVSGRLAVTDADGDTLTYTASIATAKGTAVVAADGSFIYTPSAATRHAAAADGASAAELNDTFTVMVSDGYGGTTSAVVTVAISPFNTPPTALAQVGTPQGVDGAVAGTVIGSDIDGDTLTYSAPTTTTYGSVSIDSVTGAFIYTPDAAAPGAGAGGGGGGNSGGAGGATQPVSEAGFEGGSLAGWSYGTQTGTLAGSVINGGGTGVNVISGAVTFNAPAKAWTFSPYGSYAAALQPTGGPTFADAAAAMGLTPDQAQAITTTSAGTPTDAAWMTRTVSLDSGTVYSMSWNYIGTDYEPYNDGSITSLVYQGSGTNPVITVNNYSENYALLGFTVTGTGDYSTGSYGSTGWQTSTYQVSQSGDYLLGFAVFNLDDTALSPVLLVDSEPGTTLLNGSAFTPVAPNNPNAPGSNVPSTDSFVSTVTDGHGGSATVTVTVPIT